MEITKKKGFTLIELMIVLAIIAILAVVLIPKSNIFKSNARASGVITNVNTVQAYLETKTGDKFLSAGDLQKKMSDNFAAGSEDSIKNPYKNSADSINSKVVSTTSVVVTSVDPVEDENTELENYKGMVIVVVDSKNEVYKIHGIDGDGSVEKTITIKK